MLNPAQLERMDRKASESMSIIYDTLSIVTFGLPQTGRHLCSKVIDLLFQNRDRYNTNLDIAEIVFTGGVIVGQVALMQKVYSMLP